MPNNGKKAMIERHDPQAIIKAVRLIVVDGNVTELRALGAMVNGDRYPLTYAGYFNNADSLSDAVGTIRTATGIYITPNPIDTALLSRASNRIKRAGRGESTQDSHIIRRHYLLIDADAQRASGIIATNVEHDAAIERAQQIQRYLKTQGWPEPIVADSGNGGHLMYRIDLPTDDCGLVKRCLIAVANHFDDDAVKVDLTVFNPSRIWKLYGTLAGKGDHSEDRPHRMAHILSCPDTLTVVPADILEALAGSATGSDKTDGNQSDRSPHVAGKVFDLEAFIHRYGLDVTGPEPWSDQNGSTGQRWVFNTCPWNSEHTNHSAFIIQFSNGAISAGCHHNGCANKKWEDLRAIYEPKEARTQSGKGESAGEKGQASQANELIQLAGQVELFHTPGDSDEAFASMIVNGHRETCPVSSKRFRRWLGYQFYARSGKAPGNQAIQDALNTISGKALYEGTEHLVAVRLAEHDGVIWLDLCDQSWRAIRIDANGWQVVESQNVPIRFIHRQGMLALPDPERGGSINELRPLVNLPGDDEWTLLVGFLVMTFNPVGPYPILCVNGEHGSAKSTLCRFSRAVNDPHKTLLRRPPKEERDLMIAANNAWIIAYWRAP